MDYWLECILVPVPWNTFRKFFTKFHTSRYIFISEYIFKGNEIIISKRNVYSHIHCISINSSLLLQSHFSRIQLCVTPQTAAHQVPHSLGFSRQEHQSGLPPPSPMHESEKSESEVLSDYLQHHGLQLTRLLCPWDFPSKSTGVGCHFLLHHSSLETTYYRNNLSICQHVKRLKQCDVIYIYMNFIQALKKNKFLHLWQHR